MVPGSDSITSAVARGGNQQKNIKSVERGSECEILSHIFFPPRGSSSSSFGAVVSRRAKLVYDAGGLCPSGFLRPGEDE